MVRLFSWPYDADFMAPTEEGHYEQSISPIQLLEDLRDPSEAAAYLTAALEDGSPDVFLLALM